MKIKHAALSCLSLFMDFQRMMTNASKVILELNNYKTPVKGRN